MEMVLEIACLSHGVICGYGNPHTLTPAGIKLKTGTCLGDAATLRPTIMVFAPAILDKVQVALNAKISSSSPIVQTLFKWGLAAGESNFQKGVVGAPWYYNKIVFKKVQTLLGGRVIFAATGSAPLAPQTQRFAQTAFNAPCRQGYGLTETCATSCIQVGFYCHYNYNRKQARRC
jgi:long-subunit acyl-CoA synthetase (AMP-forming)